MVNSIINTTQYIFNRLYSISGIGSLTINHLVFTILSVLGVFLIELLFVGWSNSSIKRIIKFDKSTQSDFYCWILDIFNLFNFITFLITLGSIYFISGYIQKIYTFSLLTLIENKYTLFIVIFIIHDFKNYFYHLISHKINILWKIHEFHHSATELNIITTYRAHFLQPIINVFFDALIFILLGIPPHTYVIFQVILGIHKLFIHSSIKSDWGFIGKYILVSPSAHRLHHSIEPIFYNKNFGSTLIIWDHIFKTYHPHTEIYEVGIKENPYNKKGFVSDIWSIIKNFYKSIFKFLFKRKNN